MPDPRPLRRPPITEALVDFRLKLPLELTDEHFAAIRRELSAAYPNAEPKQEFQANFKVIGGKIEVGDPQPLGSKGLFTSSADALTVAQFRGNGFTLNRLRPYLGWDSLFPEAIRLWSFYSSLINAPEVDRLALRYINHIDIPFELGEDYSVYLLAPPNLPEPIPQIVSGFLMRFNTGDPDQGIGVNVTQQLQARPEPPPKLLLDIDVYKMTRVAATDVTQLRAIFAALHEMKNTVFFNLLTERCLQLFQ